MMIQRLIFYLLYFLAAIPAVKAQVSCTVTASKKTVLVGEKLECTITLRIPENDALPSVQYRNIKESPNRLFIRDSIDFEPYADIEIFGSEPWKELFSEKNVTPDPDKATRKNGYLVFTNTFQAAVYNPGIFFLPCPVTSDGILLDTSRLMLEVVVPDIDSIQQLAAADLYPIKPIDQEPSHWTDYLPWLYIILAIILVYYILKKSRKKESEIDVEPAKEILESPWEKAMRLLDTIKQDRNLGAVDTKEFYTIISFIIREYIENQLHIPALELSSTEIIEYAEKNPSISSALLISLRQILFFTDQIKFAGAAEGDITSDAVVQAVRQFILSTKPMA